MDSQTEQVFTGYLRLTSKQREDLLRAIIEFLEQTDSQKSLTESRYTKRVGLGPLTSSACRCCGR